MRISGYLFDVYHFEDIIYLWLIDDEHRLFLLQDNFYPEIFADGPVELLDKLVKRLAQLDALAAEPQWVSRRHFYEDRGVRVLKISISRPSVLRRIRQKLFAFYDRLDIYHSDLEIPMNYMYTKGIYPLAKIHAMVKPSPSLKGVYEIQTMDIEGSINDLEYPIPRLKKIYFYFRQNHRVPVSAENPLVIRLECGKETEIDFQSPAESLRQINHILLQEDPDVILSSYGDQAIFPLIFSMAQKLKINMHLDRDISPGMKRKIIRTGSSYTSYGNTIYRAPSYPLYGRWHIDSANSFVMKESRLAGVIELARLSRYPVQRLARASTGAALTYMETHTAIMQGYLVPWQKSSLEEKKTAYQLLVNDKGGLIYQPDIAEGNAHENVIQLDFSQMYPTIMVMHNISPETVNCRCCADIDSDHVPEIYYRICSRRTGVVPETLAKILDRRRYYKQLKKKLVHELDLLLKTPVVDSAAINYMEDKIDIYDMRQGSLKWILVTSFGYLGYRNAKFGKLESHEAVTAYGRDKVLTAKEFAENNDYRLLGAIVDCIFIQKKDNSMPPAEEIQKLCAQIRQITGVEISVDSVFSWLVFCSSTDDRQLSVANRYFGRYQNGGLKYRGIALRKKDTPVWIKNFQMEILGIMEKGDTIRQVSDMIDTLEVVYMNYKKKLYDRKVPWRNLLIRRTISKSRSAYEAKTASAAMMDEIEDTCQAQLQAGEKIKYLVISQNTRTSGKYLSEEKAIKQYSHSPPPYDIKYYGSLLFKSYAEIFLYFADTLYFSELKTGQRLLF